MWNTRTLFAIQAAQLINVSRRRERQRHKCQHAFDKFGRSEKLQRHVLGINANNSMDLQMYCRLMLLPKRCYVLNVDVPVKRKCRHTTAEILHKSSRRCHT